MNKKKNPKRNLNRTLVPFNTGTRTHKSKKAYDRKKNKNLEKTIDK